MNGILKQEGYDLIGAAMEVYNEMGTGYLVEVYQECLERELASRRIPFVSQPCLDLHYKGARLNKFYRPDLIVSDEIVVELKGIKALGDNETAQMLNYLKATGKRIGYLVNFGKPGELDWRRFVR